MTSRDLIQVASDAWETLQSQSRDSGYTDEIREMCHLSDDLVGECLGTYDPVPAARMVRQMEVADRVAGVPLSTTFGLFYQNREELGLLAQAADMDSDHISGPDPRLLVRGAQAFYNWSDSDGKKMATVALYTLLHWACRYRRLADLDLVPYG